MADLKALAEQVRQRRAAGDASQPPGETPKEQQPAVILRAVLPEVVETLPPWPDAVRAVPNGFLRSALFGAIAKGRRRFMSSEKVAAIGGVELSYTGERLDQGDLDVWESVLHSQRRQAMGKGGRVTSYALLKMMGKTDTGKNRATLHTRILRLRANAVEIKQGQFSYIGGLLDEAYKDEVSQEWVISLNPKLKELYAADQFTQIDWAVRQMLSGKPLAQWLHGFYASHAQPIPYSVERLFVLCGSESERLDHFREKLHKALDAVTQASLANGLEFYYFISNGNVQVVKTPSLSQKRHLARKGVRR